MKCTKLTVVNFCQHRHRVVEFSDGLTAVIGSNGSGKSNLLGAIRLAMTGENPNAGAKAENICDLAPKTETSYVELDFEHGSTKATVRRNLRPTSPTAKLTIHTTGEEIVGDTKVTARIEEILGIDKATINDIVIVAQDEIFGFLDRTPAKRAAQFQKLFHTGQAEVIYKLIGEQLKTVQIPAVGADADDLRRRASEATQSIESVQRSLSGIPGFDEIKSNRESNAQCVRDFNNRQQLVQREATMAEQRRSTATLKSQVMEQRATVEQDIATITQAHEGNQEAAQQARVTLVRLEQLRQQQSLRKLAADKLALLQQQQYALVCPDKPTDYEDPGSLTTKVNDLAAHKKSLEAFLASFTDGVAECPTCGTSTDQLGDKLEEARKVLRDLTNEHEAVLAKQASAFTYDQQHSRYQQQFDTLAMQITQATQHLQDIPEVQEEAVDVVELQKSIDNATTYEAGLEELRNTILQMNTQCGQYDGTIDTLTTQINRLLAQLKEIPEYTEEQMKSAQQNVVGWDKTENDRRAWEQQLAISQTELTNINQQLTDLQAVQNQADMLSAWHDFAQEMRGVLHKDAAPRFVAQRNLRRLQDHMNHSMEMFETNYRVEADEGLSFQTFFNNGSVQPAERLSEGQKVILALAFRLALNLMFAENIGAMYLDEPTAYLDEHHIAGFEPVLNKLKEFSSSRGLQCIIITHERGLAPLFDAVVQL